MKPMHLLNAAIALSAGIGFALPTQAGIPVIDGGNLTQNIMTATESVSQTLKQIEQYQTQLEQYENQLQNTLAPASYIWDQAQDTINKLSQATDTLAYYKQQLGSLDDYLGQFQDLDYYKNSPCFTSAGCSDADRAALEKTQELASESQKRPTTPYSGAWMSNSAISSATPPLFRIFSAMPKALRGKWRPSAMPTSWPVSRPISCFRFARC